MLTATVPPLASVQSVDGTGRRMQTLIGGRKSLNQLKKQAQATYFDQMVSTNSTGVTRAFVNLAICEPNGQTISEIPLKIDLFEEAMPKTCENFLKLCHGTIDPYGHRLAYKDSLIYEIIPGWVIVGGDVVNNNGTGGKAAFRGGIFEDEGFSAVSYSEPGLLCMLNHGPNTNNSVFFITLKPAPWLEGVYVVFGRVTEGLEILEQLSNDIGTESGVPKKIVKISACGSL